MTELTETESPPHIGRTIGRSPDMSVICMTAARSGTYPLRSGATVSRTSVVEIDMLAISLK